MRKCFCNNSNLEHILTLKLDLPNNFYLNDFLNVKYCNSCNFYFSDSNNNQNDYDLYYKNLNNYQNYSSPSNKDKKCADYLIKNLDSNIKNILDYGCGNNLLFELLKNSYNIDFYDINMDNPNKTYDCITLCHVLEHIYDLNDFLCKVKYNLRKDGIIYIEVPNAELYSNLKDLGPLQEINIEHINFFSKLSLTKLMAQNDFFPLQLSDDYFTINDNNYYVIRGLFKLNKKNEDFIDYINKGNLIINDIFINNLDNVFIMGCGQFLYKIFHKFNGCKIINIVDDNKCIIGHKINNIDIISFDEFSKKVKENNNIYISSKIYSKIFIDKLNNLPIKTNIFIL